MGGDFGRHPVRPVVADDADDIAAADAEFDHAERDVVAMFVRVEPQQLWIGIGLGDAAGVIHHAALSTGAGVSSGSTRTSSSSPRYARFTWGSASTAAGSPSAILRPKSSTMTRWEISITTPMSCSIIMTVMPNSSLRSTM